MRRTLSPHENLNITSTEPYSSDLFIDIVWSSLSTVQYRINIKIFLRNIQKEERSLWTVSVHRMLYGTPTITQAFCMWKNLRRKPTVSYRERESLSHYYGTGTVQCTVPYFFPKQTKWSKHSKCWLKPEYIVKVQYRTTERSNIKV